MVNHHTKNKGDLGVLKAQADLCEKGYIVLLPLTEHAPFDLVGHKDGIFHRFQVKYRTISKTGAIQTQMKTCWSDKNGIHYNRYELDAFDYLCIYCPETDKCYYVRKDKISKSFTLRVHLPKGGQIKFINNADDYLMPH